MKKLGLIAMVLLAGFTLGCSPARYVMRDAHSGVVAIPANTNRWPLHNRDAAKELMKEHFPEGYVIEREEEVIVGTTTHYSEDQREDETRVADRHISSRGTTGSVDGRVTTVDETEYRIYYRRR